MMSKLYNHMSPTLSLLEQELAKHIPAGGNWKNIPTHIPSKRLEKIRLDGGRTTQYGRLAWDKPAFTLTTNFHRLSGSSNLHPTQERMLSIREGARIQSFPDSFVFKGSFTSQFKQVGNAVPPLLARFIAQKIEPYVESKSFVDLFAGVGGMSKGFEMQGFELRAAIEFDKNVFQTLEHNHKLADTSFLINDDIRKPEIKEKLISIKDQNKIGVVVGGPPCQGFSMIGNRNPNDPRNSLFRDYFEIIKAIKPEFFVMENVTGILSMENGNVIKEIMGLFRSIGYHVNEPLKLCAENFGVPQKRHRIFIIGSLKGVSIKLEDKDILFAENSLLVPEPRTVRDAISNLPSIGIRDGVYELETDISYDSEYQELMGGLINFEEFYQKVSENRFALLNGLGT